MIRNERLPAYHIIQLSKEKQNKRTIGVHLFYDYWLLRST